METGGGDRCVFCFGVHRFGDGPSVEWKAGEDREDSRVSPGFGFNRAPLTHAPPRVAWCRVSFSQADPGSLLPLKCQCGAWLLQASLTPSQGVNSNCLSGSRGLDSVMLPGVGRRGKT